MNELKQIQRKLNKIYQGIQCTEEKGAIKLQGEVQSWELYLKAGFTAAKSNYRGVINDLQVANIQIPVPTLPNLKDRALDGKHVDVLIIGGGVIGSAIARYLSKWNISILLVDKEEDLAMHQSSRNDGMIHPGVFPKPGSNKAKYNVRGNYLYEQLAKELEVPFKRVGTHLLFTNRALKGFSRLIIQRAEKNGVRSVKRLTSEELHRKEPHLSKDVKWGIYMPTTAVCPPYKMTVALAENAIMNGAEISLNTAVLDIKLRDKKVYEVHTNRGVIYPKVLINAAGIYSDHIADMANDRFFTIHPRKGEILIIDKSKQDRINSVLALFNQKILFSKTKGGGIVPTVEGNILVGPDAHEQPFREDYATHMDRIDQLINTNLAYINGVSRRDVITYLSGTRAATFKEDFIVEASRDVANLVHAAGIQSPGYASAPAIAEEIEKIVIEILKKEEKVVPKEHWIKTRQAIPMVSHMDDQQRSSLIKKNKDYGIIICRCEEISKGEILNALQSPIPVNSIDAVKRRTRAGMGRCQGGFCTPLVTRIISEHNKEAMDNITKKGEGSQVLMDKLYKDMDWPSSYKEGVN